MAISISRRSTLKGQPVSTSKRLFTTWVPVKCETKLKLNETKSTKTISTKTKRNLSKQNKTKPTEMKSKRNLPKRNQIKNETFQINI